jgi:hypothetical protein
VAACPTFCVSKGGSDRTGEANATYSENNSDTIGYVVLNLTAAPKPNLDEVEGI